MALLELDADATTALIADYPQVTLAVHASERQTSSPVRRNRSTR